MFRSLISLRMLLVLISIMSIHSIVFAQANRTWVSGLGDDVNACSRSQPCKTFAGAISKTNLGGEINVIDAGGFGAVVISKSITIDGGGSFAATLATSSTNGININITAASDTKKTVRLRNLSFNGMTTGNDGIRVVAASQVFVEDVLIDGFERGIHVSGSGVYLSVKNAIIRNVVHAGVILEPGGTSPYGTVAIEGCSISSAQVGVSARHGQVTIRDSAILKNAIGAQAEDADVLMMNCMVAHGGRGVMARAQGVIRLSQTTITRNETGLATSAGGKIISFKNNVVHGNGTDGAPNSSFPLV